MGAGADWEGTGFQWTQQTGKKQAVWDTSRVRKYKKKGRLRFAITAKVNGKKIPRDHDFPAIFHVCRLSVFNAKRTVFVFVNNVSIFESFS